MWRLLWVFLWPLPTSGAAAPDLAEVALAERTLYALQAQSFAKRREYCGYLGYDNDGELVASPAVAGTFASCSAPFPTDIAVTASYHTHGAFDDGYFNELPSLIDVDGDAQFLLNGYVATPGGRLWYVAGRERSVHLICGIGCLPIAPGFRKGLSGEILDGYTYEDLQNALGR
ncbi:DUF4329 domain-containing protein [Loktanella sp. SALINAS62]|uniref:DUF4329 domain-containing protein n=1 Tax=Loktanella sp. SALINAS62 TaxID=2706124 RepID=UPI001B8C5B29|nr:DUF4329 domain-containing protein [Loktanella sp. SALINAS62]MBS1301346.1 DUF4329 domain-containing protein [Loktanella sp. SALINAS62]